VSVKPKNRSRDPHRTASNSNCNVDGLLPCPAPNNPLQQSNQHSVLTLTSISVILSIYIYLSLSLFCFYLSISLTHSLTFPPPPSWRRILKESSAHSSESRRISKKQEYKDLFHIWEIIRIEFCQGRIKPDLGIN